MANSIFTIFNARSLTMRQLSNSFIINKAFKELAGQNHSVVIGPRGSGKTTLMRMLQVESLSLWKDNFAEEIKTKIDFTGVFVPTDIIWFKQSEELKKRSSNNLYIDCYIAELFTFHTIDCLMQSLQYRLSEKDGNQNSYKKVKLSIDSEIDLVSNLATLWKIDGNNKTIQSLRNSLILKIKDLSNIESFYQNDFDEEIFKKIQNIGDLNNVLKASVKLINAYIGEIDGKWCFLFDELELAPDIITQNLLDSIRGSDPTLIYKISLSPYNNKVKKTYVQQGPMIGQDYTLIKLPSQDDDFAKKLCKQVFNNAKLIDSDEIQFEEPEELNYYKICSELFEKDKSFVKYLNDKGIKIDDIPTFTEKTRLPEIRKLRWSVYLRNTYFHQSNNRLKSLRRAPDIYGGVEELIRQLEFNPRMIIGTMNAILNNCHRNPVPIFYQIKALNETCTSFSALLNTMPIYLKYANNVLEFIKFLSERISRIFVLGDVFYDEPKNVFYFLTEPSSELSEAIGDALNVGAIVINEITSDEINISSLLNKTFRVSYLFSHSFKLPVIKMGKIEFYKLINNEIKISRNQTQLELYE